MSHQITFKYAAKWLESILPNNHQICQLYLPANSPHVKDQCHTWTNIVIMMMIYIMMVMILYIMMMMNLPDHLNGMIEPNVAGVAAAREDPTESFHLLSNLLWWFWWHVK